MKDEQIKAFGKRAILEQQDKSEILEDMQAIIAYVGILERRECVYREALEKCKARFFHIFDPHPSSRMIKGVSYECAIKNIEQALNTELHK